MRQVKKRRRGITRISRKHQVTVPVDAMRKAGLEAGDELRVDAVGAGRIVLAKERDPVETHAGTLAGVYPDGYLDDLRDEWR